VARIVAEARAVGYEAMYLDTAPGMEKAQALYQRFGFRDVAPYTFNPIPGVRFMALRLRGGPGLAANVEIGPGRRKTQQTAPL
ncbi:MAG TPA: hypothetical protein PK177_07300, partial [Burkholderiaceae bacterium]|nr:hypothetical protein [Burkholderiaceae bacterium]